MGMSNDFHYPFTKGHCIHYAFRSQEVIMIIDASATASDIIWHLTEYQIYRALQRLHIHEFVLVHKLLDVNVVERTYMI